MSNQNTRPTDYPEVNAVSNMLLPGVQSILGKYFIGMYLHGSLASGDFNPRTSDIDFLIVTDGGLPIETFAALKNMHALLRENELKWSQKLEGAYIPRDGLRHYDPTHAPVPWLGVDGHFALETLGSDWIIQRWILHEKGIIVAGPPLKPMIDPVSMEDLRKAVFSSLCEWWSPPFPSPERFQSGDYQAYAVLTMCRSLYVLEHGAVASKPTAARWTMETLGERWNELISAATAWRQEMKFNRLEKTLEFIQYTLEHSQRLAKDETYKKLK